jgi:hypothetical protein
MRANDRAEDVVSRFDATHPIAHRFIDGVPQRAGAARNRSHLSPQQLHTRHIRRLPADIFFPHVDDAFQAEMRAGRRSANAMLSGARLGDHAAFTHAERKERLAERVVDFVCAGVVEIFSLQPNLGAAALLRKSLGKIQRRRATHVVLEKVRQLRLKRGILASFVVLDRELIERANKCLGNIASPKLAKTAGGVWDLFSCGAVSH